MSDALCRDGLGGIMCTDLCINVLLGIECDSSFVQFILQIFNMALVKKVRSASHSINRHLVEW